MNWFKYNNAPIIVIGMHRSGTTMFTKVLEECGVFMGADLSSNEESYTFTHFNEKLLNDLGGSWNNPIPIDENSALKFDQSQFLSQFLHYKRKPLNVIRFTSGVKWGWKDPRNTFTLNYWLKNYFPNAKIVHVYRNGFDVARSLHLRNENLQGIEQVDALSDVVQCFKLWEKYIGGALSISEQLGKRLIQISYEDLIRSEAKSILEIESFLEISGLDKSLERIAVKLRNESGFDGSDQLQRAVNNSDLMKKMGYIQ